MLETIIKDSVMIWNAPKDWSLDGGLIWLTGAMLVMVAGSAAAFITESARK